MRSVAVETRTDMKPLPSPSCPRPWFSRPTALTVTARHSSRRRFIHIDSTSACSCWEPHRSPHQSANPRGSDATVRRKSRPRNGSAGLALSSASSSRHARTAPGQALQPQHRTLDPRAAPPAEPAHPRRCMVSDPPMRLRGGKGSDHHTSSSGGAGAGAYHGDSHNGDGGMYGNHRYGDIEGGVGGGGRSRSGGARGGAGYNDANANIMEQQNNERIDLLSEQVARLKGLTIEIGNEVREQNSLLDNMGDAFHNTRDLLGNSLHRIGTMLQSGGAKHMCYMVAFGVGVLIFIWWLMHWRS